MNQNDKCVICGEPTEFIYAPKKSKVDLKILICTGCGFVQSSKREISKEFLEAGIITSLSCDADYSPIRVGKQQMTKSDIDKIESCRLEGFADFSILDMASARGHFAHWAHLKTNRRVVCIESDRYMTETYSHLEYVEMHIGDYRNVSLDGQFDFIYSCHTLEHFRDPRQYLRFTFNHLCDGGYLYINVPNLSRILDSAVIDDFFYDKHRVYFDSNSLIAILKSEGFQIVEEWEDAACLRFLVKKNLRPAQNFFTSSYATNFELISKYQELIHVSRAKLPRVVESLLSLLDQDVPKVVVGCGRMLDALISYGNFDLDSIDYLVDNFLSLATESLYGRKLYTLDSLPVRTNNLHFIVVSRTSNLELERDIYNKFESPKMFFIAEFLQNKAID